MFILAYSGALRDQRDEGRDLPALRQLKPRPSIEQVTRVVGNSLGRGHPWLRDVSIYCCHRHTGETLRRIGERHGGMGESAMSQTIHRLVQRMEKDCRLEKEISKILLEIDKL